MWTSFPKRLSGGVEDDFVDVTKWHTHTHTHTHAHCTCVCMYTAPLGEVGAYIHTHIYGIYAAPLGEVGGSARAHGGCARPHGVRDGRAPPRSVTMDAAACPAVAQGRRQGAQGI